MFGPWGGGGAGVSTLDLPLVIATPQTDYGGQTTGISRRNLENSLNPIWFQTLQHNRTFGTPGSVAQYHEQPAPHEVFQPFNRDKLDQKAALQPTVSTARDRVQEQGVLLTGQFFITDRNYHDILFSN